MKSVERIIQAFGGTRRLAAALNVPPSTVQSWKTAGVIPARRQPAILDAARGNGVDVRPEHFFEGEPTEAA